ncbi:hypothetical protein [Dongia sp.]|uniref:hypothetical protein n=1 Tax=Dongia sp. TaxID=1977262 RepID=UPI0035B489B6
MTTIHQPADFGLSRRNLCLGMALVAVAGLVKPARADLVPSGTVSIEQVQIAFIGSGNLGGGTLSYGGGKYDFTIGGLGVGGIGISKIEATGTVYNLSRLEDFAGAYVQARYGLAVGSLSTGELWLQNTNGVGLALKAERTGLALSLGGDAVFIDLD